MEANPERTNSIMRVFEEKGDTWPKILKYNREKFGARKALRCKHYGIWQPYTWEDYYSNVKYLALGLVSLGLESDDKVIIIGDNAPQWYYAELAVQAVHGASVGMYSENIPEEIRFIAENSEAKFAIVEDQEQVDKFLDIKDRLPLLKYIIFWNYKGLAHYDDSVLIGYKEVLSLGEEYDKKNPGIFDDYVKAGKADDICSIVYTSGTTENYPKGAVHTFKTMITGAYYYLQLDPWSKDDNIVPSMPPAWISEQYFGIGCHLLSTCIVNFTESPETQQRDTIETGPSVVISDARIWERQAADVKARILTADAVKRFAYRVCLPVGYKMAESHFRDDTKPGLFNKIIYFISDVILFRPIKRSLGLLNARICYSTGSILSQDAVRFYHALKLPLKSLYGSTEGGFITGASNDDIKLDTVGPAHKGMDVKITGEGELVYRSPGVFVGYYRDDKKTSEVLKDGWFYSGDCASIEEGGHVKFIDRLKEIVDLPNGNKMSPQNIESLLRSSPYINDAWVTTGRNGDYPSCVIILNYASVSRWAGQQKLSFISFADLSQKPEVYKLISMEINGINSSIPGTELKKFVILHREFEPDKGELTRTMKLRRTFLEETYRELIDAIYNDRTEFSVEANEIYSDGHVEKVKTNLRIESLERAVL